MKRFKGWLRKLIIICIIIILAGIAMSLLMMLESFSSTIAADAVEDYKQSEEADPLVIDIPTPCNKGHITVQDEEGATHFQYGGHIVIENDGKDGNPIEIYVYVESNDPAYDLE